MADRMQTVLTRTQFNIIMYVIMSV